MSLINLVPIEGSAIGDSAAFRQVAVDVYRDDPQWAVASEDIIAERAFDAAEGRVEMQGVVALAAGRPVARAVAIVEPDARDRFGRAEGWIGLFECLRDHPDAGVAVLQDRRSWLRPRASGGISVPRTDALRGGLVTSGFDRPQLVLTPHNPDYYAHLLARAGFAPQTSMVSYLFTRAKAPTIRVPPGLGVRVRSVETADWDRELRRLHDFQEAVFARRNNRVPRELEATTSLARRLLPMVDPDLVLVAEDSSGLLVGVLVCLPDTWQERAPSLDPDRARLLSVGVRAGWRGRGAAIAMGAALEDRLLAKGYQTLEASWIQNTNARPRRLARALGASPSRTITLYADRHHDTDAHARARLSSA